MSLAELQLVKKFIEDGPDLDGATVAEQRKAIDELGGITPVDPSVTLEPVKAGGIPGEFGLATGSRADRVVLYLHGGGYVMGSLASHRGSVSLLGKSAGARTLALDYRLAPEHPFPAAIEDAVSAYSWLLDQGIKPGKLAIAGDSAGGGLTLATMVTLRDRGLPLPAAAVCFSPWVDMEGVGQSLRVKDATDLLVKPEMVAAMAGLYLAGKDLKTPLANLLYADLRGLPPTLVQVGAAEMLYDDSTRLVRELGAADVAVTFEAWSGMPHVWQLYAGMLQEGREALARAGEYLKRHLD